MALSSYCLIAAVLTGARILCLLAFELPSPMYMLQHLWQRLQL